MTTAVCHKRSCNDHIPPQLGEEAPNDRFFQRLNSLPAPIADDVAARLSTLYVYRNISSTKGQGRLHQEVLSMTGLARDHIEVRKLIADILNDPPAGSGVREFLEVLAQIVLDLTRHASFGPMTGRIFNGLAKCLDSQDDVFSECLTEIGRQQPQPVTKALRRTVQQNPKLWRVVAELLSKIGDVGDIVQEDWLHSGWIGVEAAAIRFLAEVPSSASRFPEVASDMMTAPNVILRSAAVDAVCHFGYCENIRPLLLAATNDSEPAVYEAAIKGIGCCRSWTENLLPNLVAILHGHQNTVVRGYAAEAIGNLAERARVTIPDLQQAKRDQDAGVRWKVRLALAKIVPDKFRLPKYVSWSPS